MVVMVVVVMEVLERHDLGSWMVRVDFVPVKECWPQDSAGSRYFHSLQIEVDLCLRREEYLRR